MINTTKFFTQTVHPNQIFPSPHQPEARAKVDAPNNRLKNSIKEYGLQYPPLVARRADGSLQLIDGHRRLAAIKHLELDAVTVIVAEGNIDDLFAEVSSNVMALSARQWLEVYLNGGMLPGGPTKTNIKRLEATAGREFLQKLKDAGLSPSIWQVANRFFKYTEMLDGGEKKAAVLKWMLEHKLSRQVGAWITGDNSKKELINAFEENRPMK